VTPSNIVGGRRIRTRSSVQVTGNDFPARMWTGTPFHRQESIVSRSAAKVSTWSRNPPRLVAVPTELSSDHVLRVQGTDGLQHLRPFVPDRLAVQLDRWLHGQAAEDLEEMVLDHVTDRAGRVVEGTASLDAEVLGHRDLDAVDVAPVPEGLDQCVGETEEEHAVHAGFPR
jgi:hypothetical protein